MKQISGRVADPNEPETAAVHVPAKCVGYILGHRGASIQAMTEKTGATLRVAPANEVTTGSSEHRVRSLGPVGYHDDFARSTRIMGVVLESPSVGCF